MPDVFRKLSPGAWVTQFSITAWNRMIDMLNWWQTQYQGTGSTLIRGSQQYGIFDIKNASGSDQPWLGILGIDEPLYDPADEADGFSSKPVLSGVEPTVADHAGGKWAVLLDNVADDDMCRCAVAGVVPTFVYVNSYDDKYCDVIEAKTVGDDTTYLGSGATGAKILWWEATSSDDNGTIVWALVRLGDSPEPKFYNAASSTAPPFALMAVTGVQTLDSGEVMPKVDEPSTTFYRRYIVNGAAEVAAGTVGTYQDSETVKVAYGSGTPAADEGWGPQPGQWTAAKNYPTTCIVAGVHDDTNKVMLARVCTIDKIIGKLAGSLSQGGGAVVNIWGGAGGSETVISSLNVTARDWLMKSGATAIASGKKVVVEWINGVPYVTEAECA